MALETGTFISDLVATNPVGSDPLAFADDHLRLIKATVKNTFPNVTGAVTKTQAQINDGLEKSGGTMTGPLVLAGAPTASLQAATKAYVDSVDSALTTTVGTKADKATAITAGAGLTGGGDLSTSRSLAIADAGVTTAKIADGAVTASKIASGAIPSIATGAGAVSNGGTFTVNLGNSGTALIQVQGYFVATYGNFGTGTISISIGGTTVASQSGRTMEWDSRTSGANPVIQYRHTGTANSTVTVTFSYSGPGSFQNATYSFIGH